jgi:hypothetical protein
MTKLRDDISKKFAILRGKDHVLALNWDSQGMAEGNATPSDDWMQLPEAAPGVVTHGPLAALGYSLPRHEVGSGGA